MNNMNRFITSFIVFFVTVFTMYSQSNIEMLKNNIIITVSKKGKLEKEIEKNGYRKEDITNLKILGDLNAKDFKCINEMTALKYLDLSDVNILPGKSFTIKTIDGREEVVKIKCKIEDANVLGNNMFYSLNNIRLVKLPKNIKKICMNAFSGMQNYDIYFTSTPPIIENMKCFGKCNTIIVPSSYIDSFIFYFQKYQNKILKDNAPDTYELNVSNYTLDFYLKGAYPYVKHLKIKGKLSKDDVNNLKKCVNLESIDLYDATIQDVDNLEKWGNLLADNVKKNDTLISLENECKALDNKRLLLEKERNTIEKKIIELENRKEKQLQYEFLRALIGLSNEELEKEYKNDNMSTSYYAQNKVFNELFGKELNMELEKLGSSQDPDDFEHAQAIIDGKIIGLEEDYEIISDEMKYYVKQYEFEKQQAYQKINECSSIPNDLFKCFEKIKDIILPNNTIIISEKSLPLNGVTIQMKKEHIVMCKNMYY